MLAGRCNINQCNIIFPRLRVVGFCSRNPRRAELYILCKLGKETRREWGEAGKKPFFFSSAPALLAACGFAARHSRSPLAYRNPRNPRKRKRLLAVYDDDDDDDDDPCYRPAESKRYRWTET